MSVLKRIDEWRKGLTAARRPEPSYPVLPVTSDDAQSSVRGVYLLGEVGGTPLVKLGLNQGVEVVDALHVELGAADASDPERYDLVIVGAGSSGLAAMMRAHELGMRAVVLESERVAMTIENMYKGKVLFAEPNSMLNKSSMWFEECTREELLLKWHEQIKSNGLDVREHEKVSDVQIDGDGFVVESIRGKYRTRRVLLCVGKAGNPRKAGVPGEKENAEKILHSISDPAAFTDKKIFIYGGGDVAAEAALALCERNRVTMVAIDKELIFPKKRNREALEQRRDEGKLDLQLSSHLLSIEAKTVTYRNAEEKEVVVENDVVLEMIGAELPIPFFRKIGIALEGDWTVKRWLYLAAVFLAVYTLYALKKFPEMPYSWPFNLFIDEASFFGGLKVAFGLAFLPFRWMFQDEAYQAMLDTSWFQQGYLYSLVYTIAMAVFGWKAFLRWKGYARDPKYQKWRYLSLVSFQLGFFLIANVFALQGLSVQHAWRAWGLYQPWPLFFNTFSWWNSSDPRVVVYGFIGVGLFGTFVAIPWSSRRHGKRFCTWVCGCGGLAETLGDRWRHLSAKGKRSRAWEFQGAVILAAVFIVTLVTVGIFHTRADNLWAQAYAYIVDFWLIAVIPVALYPFFGGKVWCRYWCPLAAWNQILAKWYGKLKIKSNDQCISCTMCSRYCQVGVDVMAFAKNQEPFDNANSACIQCGICIDVCPMDVLSFDNGKTKDEKLLQIAS